MSFSDKLKQLRAKVGVTQEKLAQRTKLSVWNISNWERGICYPCASSMRLIAEALGVSLDELYEGVAFTGGEPASATARAC